MASPYPHDDPDREKLGRRASTSPLNRDPAFPSYPPMPHSSSSRSRHVRMPSDDREGGGGGRPPPGYDSAASPPYGSHRNGSWDLLAGIRKWEHSYEEFDTRNASHEHLQFAQGDMPQNKVRLRVWEGVFLCPPIPPYPPRLLTRRWC